MGIIIALIIGGFLGHMLSERVTARNWDVKLRYALGIPLLFDSIVLCIIIKKMGIMLLIGSDYLVNYAVWYYGGDCFLGSLMFAIIVLAMMKRKDKQQPDA